MIRALNDETFDQSVLEAAKLKKIFHERLPSWISYPDVDRAPWLNRAARQMWPFLNKAISNSVVWSVERPLNRLVDRSGPISSCKFSKFTLGLEPLIFVSVKAVDEVPNEIGLDIEFKWAALEPEVQLDVGLFDALKLPIAIEKIEAFGTIRLVFGPLCEWWPTFSDMQIAFIGKPTINFNLRLVGGDITKVPKVEKSLSKLIKNAIYNLMVWPNRLDIPITEQDGSIRIHHTGILRVTVYRFHGIYHSVKKVPKPALEIQLVDGDYEKPKVK
jgi:Ca2+-dependent lipid-binding protein